jgi:putative endonuclease
VRQYYVYILANRSHTLYTGVTNDLLHRVRQHRSKLIEGFTKKYNITRLVHYETFTNIDQAIAREKQIKGWTRDRKVALVKSGNRYWRDLAAEWLTEPTATAPSSGVSPGTAELHARGTRGPSLRSG